MTDALWQDIRAAVRSLRRTRGVTLAGIVMLALGIGANTAIFSVLRASSLRASPLPDPDRVVILSTTPPDASETFEAVRLAEFFAWQQRTHSFDQMGALLGWGATANAARDGEPAERLIGWRFGASMFRAFGVQPQLGRTFTDEEDRVDGPLDVVVISDGLWRRRFSARHDVIGQSIELDGTLTTIIGVMPPHFDVFGAQGDFWLPNVFSRFQVQSRSTNRVITVVAHLKDGVSIAAAQADLDAAAASFATEDPGPQRGRGVRVRPLEAVLFGNLRPLLGTLQAAVGVVLLIACANVAGLLLIRAAGQQRQVAIRRALGASGGHILRQYLAESVILSLTGGVLGILLAWGAVRLLEDSAPTWLSPIQRIDVDGGVLAFSLAMSVTTGMLFGLVPAFGFPRLDLFATLKDAARSTGISRSRRHVQGALLVAQVALTLVLLVGAGLLLRSFWRLQQVDLGLKPDRVLWFQTRLPANRYFRQVGIVNGVTQLDVSPVPAQVFERLRQRLNAIPGVVSAAGTNLLPAIGGVTMAPFTIPGKTLSADAPIAGFATGGSDPFVGYALITPNYFSTLGARVIRGREFSDRDTEGTLPVAIVNEAFAKRYWAGDDPVGQTLQMTIVRDLAPRQVVGVVADTAIRTDGTTQPTIYVPHRQESLRSRIPYGQSRVGMAYLLRIDGPLSSIGPAVRRAVAEVDPSLPVSNLEMFDDLLARQSDTVRDSMYLLTALGAIALFLAAFGIYGVVGYGVVQRTQELAVRTALGARRTAVLALVLRQSTLLTIVGVVIGLGGAAAATRYLQSLLFTLTPLDAATFAVAPLVLITAAVVAAYVPARRAASLNPVDALRAE